MRLSKTTFVSATLPAALLSALLIAGPAIAGDNDDYDDDDRHERLSERLELSDSQEEQVKAILQEQHAKKRAIHEETRERLRGVLNDEQWQKFEKMHERRKHKFFHKHGKDKGSKTGGQTSPGS